jgi:nanoRNase/pAp phosphatase (c-di-AMP/oligoRNAs hydrolase)
MINRFKIELRDEKFWEKNRSNYGLAIFCDTGPENASVSVAPEIATIIIDHHTTKSFREDCLAIIKNVGAASTIIYYLLKKAGVEFLHPSPIATALEIGIDVDTKSFTKTDEITEFDVEAHRKLMPLIDYALFRHLTERYELRKGFFKCLKRALGPDFDEIFVEDLAILGVGNIKRSQIDYIPMIADWILRAEETRLVVVIGVVDNQFIKASVRTDLESVQIDQFCQKVFGGDDPAIVASTGARPGSGGAIVSLTPAEREQWAKANPREKQLLAELKLIEYRRKITEEILPDIQR